MLISWISLPGQERYSSCFFGSCWVAQGYNQGSLQLKETEKNDPLFMQKSFVGKFRTNLRGNKTSQEMQMLSKSLSNCQSLTLNVMISVSHFVRNNQLCHQVTKSLNRSQYLCLCFCVCLCQKGHICIQQLCSALKTLNSTLTDWLTDWVTMSPIELNEVCTGAGDLSWRFVAAKKEVASL